jgi:hypothetical protein
VTTEADLIAHERQFWRERDWAPAIGSFLARRFFLPLLRLRDWTRPRSLLHRIAVGVFFYPAYLVAFVAWLVVSVTLLLATPFLFFAGRAVGPRHT